MNHFSYPLTIIQINTFEEDQNIFFPIKIPDPKLPSQISHIFSHRVPSPGSLLVPNAKDNSRPGDLTITFSKLLISCMRLHVYQVINYAELVFHMSKMSSAVDCRGSKLIIPDYYWPWDFFLYELSLSWTATDTGMYILFFQYFVCSDYSNVLEVWISFWSCWINAFTAGKLAFSLSLVESFTGYKCSRSMVPCLNILI